MIHVLRQLRWLYLCNRRRRTHPNIANSWIEDLSGIDPLAKVHNSQIYGTVALGKRCILNECYVRANSRISVGAYSILTGPIQIFGDVNAIEIGKFCSLAPHVAVWESLHNHRRITTYYILSEVFGESFRQDVTSKGAVRIGNDVWIGTRTVILSGVTIGDGAVIGAGSVVSKDIPPYAIAAGAPATPLKSRFPTQVVQRLQQLQWWDWSEEELKRNQFVFERELSLEMLDKLDITGVP